MKRKRDLSKLLKAEDLYCLRVRPSWRLLVLEVDTNHIRYATTDPYGTLHAAPRVTWSQFERDMGNIVRDDMIKLSR